MKTKDKIIQFITQRSEVTAKELGDYLNISERAVFKHLRDLLGKGALIKIGSPPKVFYKINPRIEVELQESIPFEDMDIIENTFLYITPLGEYISGSKGFIKWCKDRNLNIKSQSEQYRKLILDINKNRKDKLISATNKVAFTFETSFLDKVFYVDFYSIPQFGKTKLGQLILYAKQSQDKLRIKQVIQEVAEPIKNLINTLDIDAVGFIPPTIKREVQFMKELQKGLNLSLPVINIIKIKTDIIVPQKTLSKLSDRITNSKNTFVVKDDRKFKRVLLIDDAIGSGATLNEIAGKVKNAHISKKVFGIALVGSYKGFDVISEV